MQSQLAGEGGNRASSQHLHWIAFFCFIYPSPAPKGRPGRCFWKTGAYTTGGGRGQLCTGAMVVGLGQEAWGGQLQGTCLWHGRGHEVTQGRQTLQDCVCAQSSLKCHTERRLPPSHVTRATMSSIIEILWSPCLHSNISLKLSGN